MGWEGWGAKMPTIRIWVEALWAKMGWRVKMPTMRIWGSKSHPSKVEGLGEGVGPLQETSKSGTESGRFRLENKSLG